MSRQYLPPGTIVHVNGVPYVLKDLTCIEGGTDKDWATSSADIAREVRQYEEKKGPLAPYHDVQAAIALEQEATQYRSQDHSNPEARMRRKEFLKDFYSGSEGV